MMLGDLGADVLHIERPGKGEDARLVDPFQVGESCLPPLAESQQAERDPESAQ